MKYLDQEFATISFKNVGYSFVLNKMTGVINRLRNDNFGVIYFELLNIKSENLRTALDIVKQCDNVFIITNDNGLDKDVYDSNKVILKSDVKNLKNLKNTKCYFQVRYSKQLIQFLADNNKLAKNIIIGIPKKYSIADDLLKNLSFLKKKLMFTRNIISKMTIKKHPCNVYLCNCTHCHLGKNDFPRNLEVFANGNIFPEGIYDKDYLIGNIIRDNFIDLKLLWENSNTRKNFIELNKKAFQIYILDGNFDYLVWTNCLRSLL
ncbi:MAG: hypothetical protein LBG48_01495 [Rickettsiales bacterium]|jgi:hypothetical protein|nr:hypothetical protein [Rickettsiales bacterium]